MSSIVSYLNPWRRKREREAEQVRALRARDGDACTRCRRPLRFDLPRGHDAGARIEPLLSGGGREALDNLCLTHGRCNAAGADHTGEVSERIRRRSEAQLLSKSRTKKPRRAA
jgi:hypothetical protein